MIDVSAPSIVSAEDCADDFVSIRSDPTQLRIPLEKALDCLAVVTFRYIKPVDPIPKFDRSTVIFDAKVACLNLHCPEILARLQLNGRSGLLVTSWRYA